MSAIKLSPSALTRLIEDAAQLPVSQTKIEMIQALAQAELERRKSENAVKEFHAWIRRGDQILTEMEHELSHLRTATDPDGDFISKTAVLEILDTLFSDDETDRYDKGRNWALGKAKQAIAALPART